MAYRLDSGREIDCPHIRETAKVSRAYQIRAIGYLAGEAGIRQFLDVGAGLPAADNTHQVAQRIAPESRMVYLLDPAQRPPPGADQRRFCT